MTFEIRIKHLDARSLLTFADVDLAAVRANLALITSRGYHREQDLVANFEGLLRALE